MHIVCPESHAVALKKTVDFLKVKEVCAYSSLPGIWLNGEFLVFTPLAI